MHFFNEIIWNVEPEIFSLWGFAIRWYGLLFALSFVIGQYILLHIFKQEGRYERDIDKLMLYMVIGTVVGARLGHCLFYDPLVYLQDPVRILYIREGGLASHGATIGILFALWLYQHNTFGISYLWLLDRVVIAIALGGAFIRFGNLMNSEIIGIPTDLPWGFVFKNNPDSGFVARHPAQLYESISSLLLFFLLYSLYKKYGSDFPRGLSFGIFLIVLFGLRFCYEFIKENQVAFENNFYLNMGQILSIPLICIGVFILYRAVLDMRNLT